MPNLTLSQDIDDFLSSANKAAARSALGLGSAALASSDSFASLGSNTLTGLLSFSGTTHAGIRMNNLTTAQKNALTPAAGMVVFDTDLSRFQSYSGAAWVSHVRLTGDTMTGALAINQSAADTGILSSTGYSLTGSNSTNMLDLAGTWNTSGTPTALKIAITNTASNASSSLINLLSGSTGTTSVFKVLATGSVSLGSSTVLTPLTITGLNGNLSLSFTGSSDVIWNRSSVLPINGFLRFGFSGTTDPILTGTASTLTLTQANFVVPAGSASSPSITTSGDSNTGIYFPSADTINLTTGGVSRWSVDSNGTLQGGSSSLQLSGNSIGTYFFARGGYYALGVSDDVIIARKTAATVQLGADAAGVTNQMLTVASRITSDGVGANLTIAGGNGRGGAGGSLIFSTYSTAGTATIGTLTARLTIDTNGVSLLANCASAPAGTPSGGGYLYSESGALKWKGSSGTVTTLAAA